MPTIFGMQGAVLDAIPTPAANIQRGLAALERALTEKTTVHRAMYREGLGWVDFVWGDEGKVRPNGRTKGAMGLSHIIEARIRKDGLTKNGANNILMQMVHAIASGKEVKRIQVENVMSIRIEYNGHSASLTQRKGSNAWAVTAFEINPGARPAGYATAAPTQSAASLSRNGLGAGSLAPGDSVPSLDQATHRDSCKRGCPAVAEGSTTLDASPTDVNSIQRVKTMQTPLIRYNLKDRGRQHTGQPRNFNVRLIADAINSPATQEMVESRGMVGFYGHFPRIRFGMNPAEGGIDGGRYVPVEPAFVTTYLKADYDGNVEHRAEFLDTAAGKLSAKLWDSRTGGFSSAIDDRKPAFFGFDYVIAPNYLDNSYRGVVLDDAFGGNTGALTYDAVFAAEMDEHAQGMSVLLDSINAERATTAAIIERLQSENDELLSMLARAKGSDAARVLDSAATLPMPVKGNRAVQMERDAATFKQANLPRFVEPQAQAENDNSVTDTVVKRMMSRWV